MGRRQPKDLLVKGDRLIFQHRCQVVSDPGFIEAAWDLWQAQEGFDFGSKRKDIPRAIIVIKWFDAKMIPGTEQLSVMPIPNGKGKVTQKLCRAGCPPFLVGGQDELTISDPTA